MPTLCCQWSAEKLVGSTDNCFYFMPHCHVSLLLDNISVRWPSFQYKSVVIIKHKRQLIHRDIQIQRGELKIRRAVGYFWRNSRSWIANETLSQVFDIAPDDIDRGPFEPTEDGLEHFGQDESNPTL